MVLVDPKDITLYTLVHDWWGVAAFAMAGYKLWDYVKSFKSDIKEFKEDVQVDLKATKEEMLTNTSAIKTGLEHQTVSIVNELRELRQDFRATMTPAAFRSRGAHDYIELDKHK